MNFKSTLGLNCLFMAMLTLALSACSGADPQPPTAQPAKPVATKQAKPPTDTRVKAVATGPGSAPIDLQFELAARPQLNSPIEINLYLLGTNDATALTLGIKAAGKLQVIAGEQASFSAIKVGELLTHSFSVRSASTGIQVADVQLVATLDGQPKTFNFAIPIAISPSVSAASSASP